MGAQPFVTSSVVGPTQGMGDLSLHHLLTSPGSGDSDGDDDARGRGDARASE